MKPFYQDELVTIYNENSKDIIKKLSFDYIITDPPYGLGGKLNGGKWGVTKKEKMLWDITRPDEIVLSLPELASVVAIWGGNYYQLPLSRGWLSWFKPDAPPSMANFELAWTNRDKNARQISYSIAATNPERCGHPTQKPVAVMKWTINEVVENPNGIICDPFAGSGTTLVAAKREGIKSIGIEINERFCKMAVERLRQSSLFNLLDKTN